MPSSTAWSITPTGSISTARACGEPANPAERPEPVAAVDMPLRLDNAKSVAHMPHSRATADEEGPSSRDSRLTPRLHRCQKPKSQNASRPRATSNRNGGRDHLGILGEIKSVHPGEIIGIRTRRFALCVWLFGRSARSAAHAHYVDVDRATVSLEVLARRQAGVLLLDKRNAIAASRLVHRCAP